MFIILLLTTIASIYLINSSKIDKFSKYFLLIYNIISFIILSFSTTNPYDLYSVSNKTYLLWILHLLIFTLTYVILIKKKNGENNIELVDLNEKLNKITQSKALLIFQSMTMLVLIFYVIKYNYIVSQTGDISSLRMIRYTTLFNSYTEKVIFEYIIMGALTISSIITTILLVNKKCKNPFFIIGILNILLYVSIGYSRKILLEFIIYIVLAYLIMSIITKKRINRKTIFVGLTLVLVVCIIMLEMTAIRTGVKIYDLKKIANDIVGEQIKQVVLYFEGPLRTLDNFINEGFESLNGNLAYGRATLAGIDEIISLPLIFVGIDYPYFNSIIGSELQTNVTVSENGYKINAFYTGIMNFYADFGTVGVLIFSMLYATLVVYCVRNFFKKKGDIFSQVLLIFVIMNTLSIVYRWNYQSGATTFLLIVLVILNNTRAKTWINDVLIKLRNKFIKLGGKI